MITFLAKRFIPNYKNTSDKTVRGAYGILCSVVGILLNVVLFIIKLLAGTISGSIAITADAINNLSDAGSSVITLMGFRLASKKPDSDHPFGHGRSEYISGLIVSMVIVVMGVELLRTSFDKIMNPGEDVVFDTLTAVILVISVVVKLYMALYNKRISKKIDSAAMSATSADSLSDSCATTVVLIGMIVSHFTSVNIDGYMGFLVAAFIIFAGVNAAKDTISPLLGEPPTEEFVKSISDIVMSHDSIVGMHDLIVHNYGPGRVMISLHAEVSDKEDILKTHDLIDNIERDLSNELGCIAVIHMDPVASDDENTNITRELTSKAAQKLGEGVTIHDFRMVVGDTHTNIIFDVCVPYSIKMTDSEVVKKLSEIIKQDMGTKYNAVIDVDRDMTGH